MRRITFPQALLAATLLSGLLLLGAGRLSAQTQQSSGAAGVEGRIPTGAPTQAATITVPSNGQSFTTLPITVSGLCPAGLLVEIFKNGVFAGSVECVSGSYSIGIDLFEGRNDLIARVFDSLNQAGPDSSTVSVTFSQALARTGPRVSITTNFAKRGAPPGSSLSWPISISGGRPPYAISVDWGDKNAPDLISREVGGDFNIEHVYGQAGSYNVIIKVSDSSGDAAFLQVVGIGNGPIQQRAAEKAASGTTVRTEKVVLWWPFVLTLALTAVAFWLGQRHQLQVIRERLRRGERPFK